MADCKESAEQPGHSSLILKVDPPEDSSKSSAENSEQSNSTTSTDRGVLAASKLGNSFGANESSNIVTSKSKSSILRPSQLSSVTNSSLANDKNVLQPSKFNNPFTKVTDNSIEEEDTSATQSNKGELSKDIKDEEKPAEEAKPKFLPLDISTKENENNVNSTMAPSASTPSFVFGQNLKERVTVSTDTESSDNSEKEEAKSETKEETNENGSSELLFSNAAAVCRATVRPGLTLSQAAQALEEANRANKRKYNQVTLLTGEEGETNVLQINCKLFAFDKTTCSWLERGRGTLRLNDLEEESRLVGRTAGTQRVILNTKVWPGMTAERAGPKSLRLTAMEMGDVRIVIVQAAPKEIDQLHILLLQRLKRAQERPASTKRLATEH
ncbi:ran-binding protein 3 isoform X2 [Odontomachus brunneus]|uniref:ran-binding protein 3 isoform X2 n=1 Tax=Odontomachus brunneus TaxID=486640 RepID=UPI0013F224D6|nr:ran-binding protein 3 isoform X2 [Odontomachus brunneus]